MRLGSCHQRVGFERRGRSPGLRARRHRGFTLTEMVVATSLGALLGILLATAVAAFARPAGEVDGRTRLALEIRLAVEALANDMGGYLPDAPDQPGTRSQYDYLGWEAWSEGQTLALRYRGTSESSPIIVTYEMSDHRLVRTRQDTNASTVVASHLIGFQVESDPDVPENVRITLTVRFPDPRSARQSNPNFTETFVLVGVKPPS